ncbi:MAG: hypothetical protein D6714_13170 [Bacteroidetes bacterium]|nr:MAG: hypothetical protein D6714_13170 [Bacteroidota bacterium]
MPEKESAKLLRYEGGNVMGTMPESADAFGLSEDPANNRCPGLLLNGATAQPWTGGNPDTHAGASVKLDSRVKSSDLPRKKGTNPCKRFSPFSCLGPFAKGCRRNA